VSWGVPAIIAVCVKQIFRHTARAMGLGSWQPSSHLAKWKPIRVHGAI